MKNLSLVITSCLILVACSSRGDIIIADFEGPNFGDWEVEGTAFESGPVNVNAGLRAFAANRIGFMGDGYVHSAAQSTGVLTSPPFKVDLRYLVFLLGGPVQEQMRVDLLHNGEVVRTITERSRNAFQWESFDLEDLRGEEVQIRIVDQMTNGRIQADHFHLSDEPVKTDTGELLLDKRYINLPVTTGEPRKRMTIRIDDEFFTEVDIELSESEPDYYVFIDAEEYIGKQVSITVDPVRGSSSVMNYVSVDDEIKGADDLYREPLRQQFHFSSRRGWLNDPNGLVYYDGEYHLFYQHNPYGWGWGNMHWGHAISTDLVHWEEQPTAIRPLRHGDWAFSGGATVDIDNTAGFKTGEEDVIILSWTSTGRGESISYSNDRGRTFMEYNGNPVVEHRGRDPKVFWYDPGEHWVMAVYHQDEEGGRNIAFHTSDDLKSWTFQSMNGNFFECPEVFELAIDGDPENTKWLFYEANGKYTVGSFDGKVFTEEFRRDFHYGNTFYASQTFSNIPEEDGRRIQIGWGRGADTPGMPFNQSMLFPTELTLRTTDEGLRLFAEPVNEIELLHQNELTWSEEVISSSENPVGKIPGELFHIVGTFEVDEDSKFGFNIHGTELIYDASSQELRSLDQVAPLVPENGKIHLEILVDRITYEVFGNNGYVYMPMSRNLSEDDSYGLEFTSGNGTVNVESLKIYDLKSIWN